MKEFERVFAAAFLCLVAPSFAQGAIRPSFDLEHCAWHATEIVVASEGAAIDGELTVTKTLFGTLEVGDPLSLPELGRFRTESSRTVQSFGRGSADQEPPHVLTGKKLILFIKRGVGDAAGGPVWKPVARFGGMDVSAVWIEDGHVYGITQVMNPGPSLLISQEVTESELERRVLDLLKIRGGLAACAEQQSAERRALGAVEFIHSPRYYAREEAFRLLSSCGDAALPHLRKLLRDPERVPLHDDAVRALATAGGEAIASELTTKVEEDLAFWRETAPGLSVGWWNGAGLEWDEVGALHDRYSATLAVFYALRKVGSADCGAAVREFRDYWRSLPQLEDKNGLDQMSQACDAVLKQVGARG